MGVGRHTSEGNSVCQWEQWMPMQQTDRVAALEASQPGCERNDAETALLLIVACLSFMGCCSSYFSLLICSHYLCITLLHTSHVLLHKRIILQQQVVSQ